MLKSTHRPAQVSAPPPLPSPWSEHKAPSGHTYYYNTETKKSTYTRPTLDENREAAHALLPNPEPIHWSAATFSRQPPPFSRGDNFQRRGDYDHRFRHSRHREDRPKSKHAIPGCHSWLLVKTRLGRRFVHNPSTGESFWKIPQDLIAGLVEFDIQERDGKEHPEKEQVSEETSVPTAGTHEHDRADGQPEVSLTHNEDDALQQQRLEDKDAEDVGYVSDEYEEVEVTDDEGEEDEHTPKRQKLDGEEQGDDQPRELGEEDMAYQLAQMGASYDLDPGEYGEEDYEGDWEEGAEGLPLSAEEAAASFKDVLDDYNANPYAMWDSILTDNRIVEDERYTLLPNMKARKEVFAEWSAARIQALKQQKEQQIKQNPRIPYLTFLQKHATPKLFWPEFKRKFKREPELKDAGLSDKDREKLYREHITRITKSSNATLKKELEDLLESIPPSQLWNRSTSLDSALPPALLTDVRYISLQDEARDMILKEFIATLPSQQDAPSEAQSQDDSQRAREREAREMALKRRNKLVENNKRQQEKQLLYGQRRLKEEEAELDRALRVGKGGLLENLKPTEESTQIAD